MSHNRQCLASAILTTGIATLISFGISFLMTPYVTDKLGAAAYGFITLANTFVSYATMLTTALNSYATRFIAVEYLEGSKAKANEYFSTLFFGNVVLSAVLFVIAIVMDINIGGLIEVPERLLSDVQYLLVLVFVNFVITTISSSFSSSAYIRQRLDVYGVFQSLSYVVQAAVLVVLYCALPARAFFYGWGLLAAGIVLFVGNVYIYRRYTPDLRIDPKMFSWGSLQTLVVNGIWNSINALGNTLNSGLDLLIGNMMLGPLAMGQIAISRTFQGLFSRLFQLVSQAFQPLFLQSYSTSDEGRLRSDLVLSMKVSGYISCVLFAGFFALCKVFYGLWIPGQNIDVLYVLTLLTVACSLFEGPVYPLYYVYTLKVKNKIPCFITLAGGVVNVLGMFALLKLTGLGVYAVALTTAAVMGFINLVTNPIYISDCLGIKPSFVYCPLVRILVSAAVMCLVFHCVANLISPTSWLTLVISGITCVILSLPIYGFIAVGPSSLRMFLRRITKRG